MDESQTNFLKGSQCVEGKMLLRALGLFIFLAEIHPSEFLKNTIFDLWYPDLGVRTPTGDVNHFLWDLGLD